MKRGHLSLLSFIVVLMMGLLQISSFSPLVYVAVGDTLPSPDISFESEQLRAVLRRQQPTDDQWDYWQLTMDQVAIEGTALGVKVTSETGTNITTGQVAGATVTADATGIFSFAPEATQLIFFAQKGQHLTVSFFQEVAGEYRLLGNITTEAKAQSTARDDETASQQPASSETTTSSLPASLAAEKTLETTDSSAEALTGSVNSRQGRSVSRTTGNPQVPKGAILLDGVFGEVNAAGNQASSGVATIRDPQVNNGVPYSEISLAGTKNWLSIWANEEYRMDFSQSFHGRTYINFGLAAADGLAFVMQNAGPQALTSANSGDDGQNLGVYGSRKAWRESLFHSWKTPETTAIKKSVAIEFDLYTNNDNNGHLFDKDYPQTPHMAYSFPGNLEKGYRPNGNQWYSDWSLQTSGADAILRHYGTRQLNGVVGDQIQDQTWYEFRYDFDQPRQQFSYYLKNPVTGAQTEPVTIPWADLKSELGLTDQNMKAYWGFTGANGAASGEVKFVFTQVPIDLRGKIVSDVLAEGNSIVDSQDHEVYDPQLPAANRGATVQFQTRLTVDQGEVAIRLTNWRSYISPEQFQLASGAQKVVAQIGGQTYPGTATVDQQTGEVQAFFAGLTVAPGETVLLSYELPAKKLAATQKAYFSSRITTSEVGTVINRDFISQQVAFWIKGNQGPALTDLATGQTVFRDFLDVFEYSFNYQDEDGDTLTCRVLLNGVLLEAEKRLNSSDTPQRYEGSLKEKIDLLTTTPFQVGENTLTVSLDDGVNPPVTQQVTFSVAGYFGFEELTKAYHWQYSRTALKAQQTAMPRTEEMSVMIRDTRPQGKQTVKLSLQATAADPLLNGNERFTFNDGRLGDLTLPVNQKITYDQDQGLLLKLSDQDQGGTFKGTLTWRITDAP